MKSRRIRLVFAGILSFAVLGWACYSLLKDVVRSPEILLAHQTRLASETWQGEKGPGQIANSSIPSEVGSPRKTEPTRFSATEMAVLRDLPNICTSELPGITFDDHMETLNRHQGNYPVSQVDYETSPIDHSPRPTPALGTPPPNRTDQLPDSQSRLDPNERQPTPAEPQTDFPTERREPHATYQRVARAQQRPTPALQHGVLQHGVDTSNRARMLDNRSTQEFPPANSQVHQSFPNEFPIYETRIENVAKVPETGNANPANKSPQTQSPQAPQNQPRERLAQLPRTLEQLATSIQGEQVGRDLPPGANPNPHGGAKDLASTMQFPPGFDPHADVFSNTPFPSAAECAKCHQQIFEEWSSSSHAYASISPMFHRFEDTINKLSQGTIGYFCMRCHAPVATTMGLRRDQPIFDGPRVFREGVTCVACHRVKNAYTKSNGERRIEPGDIFAPIYGGEVNNGSGIAEMIKYKEYFKVKDNPLDKSTGQAIHSRSIQFEELSKSEFCMSCHQVAVQPGIKLEVVWDQYRASPAYREGTTCQDCHMGRVPGVNAGYTFGPAAVVDNKVVNPERKHSNHVFYGPGYSIAHPGIFPHNLKADRWHVNQWLEFDWRAGWGTDKFEDAVADGLVSPYFPPVWKEADDRYDAREIVDENLKKLVYKKDLRRQVMENGSKIDGPFFRRDPQAGQPLKFNFVVSNLNPGHNMPSGSLGAQPQLWLNVVLIGPDGRRLWESGDLDSWGDLRDLHSTDVVQRKVPLDKQLFNLQTKFLTTNVKGTDREMFLPINVDFDQLAFIRPAIQPVTVQNHPPFIRMEGHSIPPLGSRKAKYVIPASLLQYPGTYRLSVRLRSRAEPIYFMRFVGASSEMIRMMNEWIVDAHSRSVVFEVH